MHVYVYVNVYICIVPYIHTTTTTIFKALSNTLQLSDSINKVINPCNKNSIFRDFIVTSPRFWDNILLQILNNWSNMVVLFSLIGAYLNNFLFYISKGMLPGILRLLVKKWHDHSSILGCIFRFITTRISRYFWKY